MIVRMKVAFGGLCLAAAFPAQGVAQDAPKNMTADAMTTTEAAVVHQIDRYVASINTGDVEAAKMLWKDSGDITFINTAGIHQGWSAINRAVHTFFRDKFTKRDLRLIAVPAVQIFGNVAIAEFTWDFDGIMTNGSELHTRGGRESQVYVRIGTRDWRLVHAHYSLQPPPITPMQQKVEK